MVGSGSGGGGGSGGEILHVDMDAFYVSVEIRESPELAGLPVVVGGAGPRGVVAAASYAARVYGVHSAMASARARQLCPHAVFLPGNHDLYREVSAQIMELFANVTPIYEPLSLDEAFLDVSQAGSLFGDPPTIAKALRQQIFDEQNLQASVGVASSKHIAKLASEQAKPMVRGRRVRPGRGVVVVAPGRELDFLAPLPVRAVWGIGPRTGQRLQAMGIATVGQLARTPVESLVSALGQASGTHLHRLANGIDERPVVPDRKAKSISHEETFPVDLADRASVQLYLVKMADAVGSRLRKAGVRARTVQIKVRRGDFTTWTRSRSLDEPTASGRTIAKVATVLFDELDHQREVVSSGIRLVGVGTGGFTTTVADQLSFDDLLGSGNQGSAHYRDNTVTDAAVDLIRSRFGHGAIGPARTLEREIALQDEEFTANRWGPQ